MEKPQNYLPYSWTVEDIKENWQSCINIGKQSRENLWTVPRFIDEKIYKSITSTDLTKRKKRRNKVIINPICETSERMEKLNPPQKNNVNSYMCLLCKSV